MCVNCMSVCLCGELHPTKAFNRPMFRNGKNSCVCVNFANQGNRLIFHDECVCVCVEKVVGH